MAHPSKRKGDEAEREIAKMLADLTGWPVERKLGAGRKEDTGDLYGIPDCTTQVKNYPKDLVRSIREGLHDLARQQHNAHTTHGVLFVRRPKTNGMANGDQWLAVMTIEQVARFLMFAHEEGSREEGPLTTGRPMKKKGGLE